MSKPPIPRPETSSEQLAPTDVQSRNTMERLMRGVEVGLDVQQEQAADRDGTL